MTPLHRIRFGCLTMLVACGAAAQSAPGTPADGVQPFASYDFQCDIDVAKKRCNKVKDDDNRQMCRENAQKTIEQACIRSVFTSDDVLKIIETLRAEHAKALQDAEARARKREANLCRAIASAPTQCASLVPSSDAN